jgi:hypothetical protein
VDRADLDDAVRDAVAALLGEVEGTVGVITPDARFRDRVTAWTAEHWLSAQLDDLGIASAHPM